MEKSRDLLTGVIFIGILLVLGVFTIFLADVRFGPEYTLDVFFPKGVGGLEEGNQVRVDGLRAGKVEKITREEGGGLLVEVLFEGDPWVFDGAELVVTPSSIIGGRVLEITNPADRSAKLDLGKRAVGRVQADPLVGAGAVMEKIDRIFTQENIDRVSEILASLDGFSGKLDRGVGDVLDEAEEAAKSIKSFAESLESDGKPLLANLNAASDRINRIASDLGDPGGLLYELGNKGGMTAEVDRAVRSLREAAGSVRNVAAGLERGEGTMGKLLSDDGLFNEVAAAVGEIKQVAADLKRASSAINADQVRNTVANVEAASRNIQAATAKLQKSDNIVGLLLTDPKMADKLRRSVENLSKFLESQRENAPLSSFATILLKAF